MKRLATALVALAGIMVAGSAHAESCTKSRDYILTDASDLPQKPQVYRQLYQHCLDTLSLSNVKDAFIVTSGAIGVLPRIDSVSATAGTLAQFCDRFPKGTVLFVPTRQQSSIASVSRMVRMSSVKPTSCADIKQ